MATGSKPGPLSPPGYIDAGTLPRIATPTPGPIGMGPRAKLADGPTLMASSVTALEIEFDAFIPGALGKSFKSYEHPTDLKNQAAFDAAISAVTGTWLEEPGTFSAYGTGPWCYATDDRDFGGGSHRVGFRGTIRRSDIGSLARKGDLFKHDTSGSVHIRWVHTGYVTSKGEIGSLNGPINKSAPISSTEERVDNSSTQSTVTTTGSASYPFKEAAPNIDYEVKFVFARDPGGQTVVRFEITNNKFPYYELLINGGTVWNYTSADTGPGPINLNTSTTFKSGFWYF